MNMPRKRIYLKDLKKLSRHFHKKSDDVDILLKYTVSDNLNDYDCPKGVMYLIQRLES